MSEDIFLSSDQSIDAVMFERQRIEQEKHPDIKLVDKLVLKDGPRAYKVAYHWVFVNRHTGEINHHTLRLETYRKTRPGWKEDLEHSLTLEDKDEKEVTQLFYFLGALLNKDFSDPSGSYLIIPAPSLLDGTQSIEALIRQLSGLGQKFDVSDDTINLFLELSQKSGANVTSRLIDWMLKSGDIEQVVDKLETLEAGDIQKLNTAIGLSALKSVLEIWQNNKENSSEEFWQQVLAQNSFVFAQVFAFPVVVIKGKAYVGGKSVSNVGGNIVDFLCANNLTMNTALVEIKTPKTKLLGSQYRGDIFNVSEELSGSVVQVSNYKNILTKSYHSLIEQTEDKFEVFNPLCVVIIGNIRNDIKNKRQQKSFELFRMGLKDIIIITFDELFAKIQILIAILEGESLT